LRYAAGLGAVKTLSLCWICASCAGSSSTPSGSGADAASGADAGSSADTGSAADTTSSADATTDGGSLLPSGLWYASASVSGFTAEQLRTSASIDPQISVTEPSLPVVNDVAMDAKGNAWVVGVGSDNVFRLPAAALTHSGSAMPDLVIQSTSLKSPGTLTFDASGSLWVASRPPAGDGSVQDGSILRFDVPSSASGMTTLSPTARITSTTTADLLEIGSLTFDANQSLWVTSFAGVLRFDNPRSQSGDVAVAPGAVIDKKGYSNDIYFYGVAFDPSGSLWASSSDGLHYLTSLTEFKDPGSLQGRSSPAAAATIQGVADVLPAGGVVFDGGGNLWMATAAQLVMFSGTSSLSGMVNPTANVIIQVTTGAEAPTTNSHLVFFPPPELVNDGGTNPLAPDATPTDASLDADIGVDAASYLVGDGNVPEAATTAGAFSLTNVVGTVVDGALFSEQPCCAPVADAAADAAAPAVLLAASTDGRTITCSLSGAFAPGDTYMLAGAGPSPSECTYTQPAGQVSAQWVSSGGSLTVVRMAGDGFWFTLQGVTMVPDGSVAGNPASGTFILAGTGTGEPQ
jgi:sugar lactone lactonase YvrE